MRVGLIFAIALCAWTEGLAQPISPDEPAPEMQKSANGQPGDGTKDQENAGSVIPLPGRHRPATG